MKRTLAAALLLGMISVSGLIGCSDSGSSTTPPAGGAGTTPAAPAAPGGDTSKPADTPK